MQLLSELGALLWNFPDGLASLLGGFTAIGAALIAWWSISHSEAKRRAHEREAISGALIAEMLNLSRSVIEAASTWNVRAHAIPAQLAPVIPVFAKPIVYEALVGQLGLLQPGWVAGAVVGFYGGLLEINALAQDQPISETNAQVAERIRAMASNLLQAFDGLRREPFRIPLDINPALLTCANGRTADQHAPKSINELLDLLSRSRELPNPKRN